MTCSDAWNNANAPTAEGAVSLKLIEVLVLLCAGALFVAWQWRDLRRAREHTHKQREAERLNAGVKAPSAAPSQMPHER